MAGVWTEWPGWLRSITGDACFLGKVVVVSIGRDTKITGRDRLLLLVRLVDDGRRAGLADGEILGLMQQFNEIRCEPVLSPDEFAAVVDRCLRSPQNTAVIPPLATKKGTPKRLRTAALSQLPRETVDWLWPGRIPLGKVTVIAGEPDLGKTLLSCDIAARVSRGADWPDVAGVATGESTVRPGRILLLNADDNLLDAIGPRLEAAGADMEHIVAIQGIDSNDANGTPQRRGIDLTHDLPVLREHLRSMADVRLVIIDPIAAYCGPIGRHPTGKTRQVVSALSELAVEFNVAILLVTDSRNTGLPSRVSWAVQRDPFDAELRLWSPVQFHYGPLPEGLGFRIREGRVDWDLTPVKLTAKEAGGGSALVRSGCLRLQVIADWLRRFLETGPREAREVYDAGAAAGLSAQQVWRGKGKLGVRVTKAPNQFGKWIWELTCAEGAGQVEGVDRAVVTSG